MDGFLAALILGVVVAFAASEAKAWAPYLSRCLLRSAFARLPAGIDDRMRSRWEEEIEADLNAYSDRPLGELVFALRLRGKGGRRLAGELISDQILEDGSRAQERSAAEADPVAVRLISARRDGADGILTYEIEDGRGVQGTLRIPGLAAEETSETDR